MIRFEQIEHASRTDVGVRRSHNQDSHTVLLAASEERWRAQGHVFMVADGMGAHAVGELASAMACQIIPHTYEKHAAEGVPLAMRKAFHEANASIHDRGQKNREFQGMGTTGTALVILPDGAWVAHVGDSRAYRVRKGQVQQLSFDHSLVWEKARRKHVRPEDLQGVPHNVIVRSLGPDGVVDPDIQGPHPVEEGDLFVLCSDGLSGPLTDEEIGAIATALPPDEACQLLIDLTNLRGGPDNITVVLVRIGKSKTKVSEEEDEGPPKVPLYRRVPWPLGIVLLGLILAGVSAALIYNKLAWGPQLFLLAAVVIVAGLIGLGVFYFIEKRRAEKEIVFRPRVKIYREADCRIDRGLFDKLWKAAEMLEQQAREKNWELDWALSQKHTAQMKKLLEAGNLTSAFRECCRAMRPLAEAVQRHRNKEESFKPVWDKTARKR